jgi:hypothetical protein
MRIPSRASFAVLVGAALSACGGKEGAGRTTWVFDRAATIAHADADSKKWTTDKLNAWKLDVRLVLESNNTFAETIVGSPQAGTATGHFKSRYDGILLIPDPGKSGGLPSGEFVVKQFDANHLDHTINGLHVILAKEGTLPAPAAPGPGTTSPPAATPAAATPPAGGPAAPR